MATKLLKIDTPLVALTEAKRFAMECLEAVGTPKSHSKAMGDVIIEADYRGHYSHGMNRLEMYVNDVKNGRCDAKANPSIISESPATAWVDGKNGLGAVVGNYCMDLAIQKAKQVGVGWVCAKGSNHYGIAGWYAMRALKSDMLGMSFTNTSPLVAPTRSAKAALGTNPLSLAAPGLNGDSFVLDMATSAVALGKIEIQRRKNESLPDGWAQDSEGNPTTDAEAAKTAECLMPLGGQEITSGYKGTGLGMLVEIFCGILAGSHFGPHIRSWSSPEAIEADLGQCFIAVDPKCFAPGFKDRLSELTNDIRNLKPSNPANPVLVAGDTERMHMKAVEEAGGVRYVEDQWNSCDRLSKALKIKPLQPLTINQ